MDTETRARLQSLFRTANLKNIEDICNAFCEEVVAKYNNQQKRVEAINKELTDLRSESWKDETLQDMKARLKEMEDDYYRGFPITESEQKAIRAWKEKHDIEVHKNLNRYHGVSGGGYTYEFYPTAIGTSGQCICDSCRRKAYEAAIKENGTYDSSLYRKYMEEHDGSFEFQELG